MREIFFNPREYEIFARGMFEPPSVLLIKIYQ